MARDEIEEMRRAYDAWRKEQREKARPLIEAGLSSELGFVDATAIAFRAGAEWALRRAEEVCNRLRQQAEESWRELDDEATYFRAAGMGECASAIASLSPAPPRPETKRGG